MTPESVMMMGTEAMKVALALAAPLLLVALVTGLIISILQAATQINEMTLSFIRKRKLTAVCSHQTRIGNLDAHLTQTDI